VLGQQNFEDVALVLSFNLSRDHHLLHHSVSDFVQVLPIDVEHDSAWKKNVKVTTVLGKFMFRVQKLNWQKAKSNCFLQNARVDIRTCHEPAPQRHKKNFAENRNETVRHLVDTDRWECCARALRMFLAFVCSHAAG